MEAKSYHQPNQGGTCKNYATSKAEYTNTQLDLPRCEESTPLPLDHAAVWLMGFGLPKALAEFLNQVLTLSI